MAAKFYQDLADDLTCTICLGQYQDPRILPCQHTYCKGCLEELLNKGLRRSSIECPQCRKVTKVQDVSSLPSNIWINKIKDLEKNQDGEPQLICNNCDDNEPVKARCLDCKKHMCDSCIGVHNRMTELKDHWLIFSDKPKLCDKHKGKKHKLFCDDCKVLICRDCTLIDHKDHGFLFIAEVVEKYKEKFKSEINILSKTEQDIESALNTVKAMEKRVRKNSDDIEQEIDTVIDAKIQALEEKRAALKLESRNMTALKMKRLSEQKNGLSKHSKNARRAVNATKDLLENGNSSDILSMVEKLENPMSELLKEDIDDKVDEEDKVELEVNEKETGILRLNDLQSPDPNRCELRTVAIKGTEPFFCLLVRNSKGNPIDINKSRILVSCPFDTRLVHFLGVYNTERYNWIIKGNYHLFQQRGIDLLSGELEVFIDGRQIQGCPYKVWCW